MAKNLTDLTARTETADSDLIHVNSGGTDYKESKSDFLKGSFYYEFGNTTLIKTQVDNLPAQGTWFGRISSYGKQSETGAPENSNGDLFVQKYNGNYAVVDFHLIGNPDSTYRICKANGTWGSAWTKIPTRSDITSLNNRLAHNAEVDGVRILTSGSNFRYVRIKRESAQTSFYGMGLILAYANFRSCIFTIGPETPRILPLGSTTPTGTYSYSSGVNTAVIDLGASGQGLVILGGSLGRSTSTMIELLASL